MGGRPCFIRRRMAARLAQLIALSTMMAAFHDRPKMDNDVFGFAVAIAGRCK